MNAVQRFLTVLVLACPAVTAPLTAASRPKPVTAADCILPKCVVQRLAVAFNPETCQLECRAKQARIRANVDACPGLCARVRAQALLLAKRACRGDADGDGIVSPTDLCPATRPFVAVNWMGCEDADRDSVPDSKDLCPGTSPGAATDLHGCDRSAECTEGQHCGTSPAPVCDTPQECDRLSEQPLPGVVPREALDRTIRRFLARRAHPLACPSDRTPPDQPRLTFPLQSVTRFQVGEVVVTLKDGQVESGPSLPLRFTWTPVTDPCEPVTYSAYLEYYHCHDLPGLIETASYRNRGWCRWVPYLYESVPRPELAFDFPFGKVLYDIHKPFGPELAWNPPLNGAFPIQYMPFWLRLRVIAHDGNGTASPFDLHADQRYIVLYADDTVPLDALTRIPVAPP